MVPTVVRLIHNFSRPWVQGLYPSPFAAYWKYLDIDLERGKAATP
jgi:hypothetical protein